MRYALLIYGSEGDYAGLTTDERMVLMEGHSAFAADAQKRGTLTGGAQLQPVGTATTIRVRSGKTVITDGPFAETKEQLAGFYLLDCQDLDEAIALAARIPDVALGSIEIRPVVELSQPG